MGGTLIRFWIDIKSVTNDSRAEFLYQNWEYIKPYFTVWCDQYSNTLNYNYLNALNVDIQIAFLYPNQISTYLNNGSYFTDKND